jgi:hypothetical protein
MMSSNLFLDLCITMSSCYLSMLCQSSIKGAHCQTTMNFSHFQFQILHTMKIIIIMSHDTSSCILSLLIALCGQLVPGGKSPIESQHALAKLHFRNRCTIVSSLWRIQYFHMCMTLVAYFFLLRTFWF